MVTSAKDAFIVGADDHRVRAYCWVEEELMTWLAEANAIFNSVEDLPDQAYPSSLGPHRG